MAQISPTTQGTLIMALESTHQELTQQGLPLGASPNWGAILQAIMTNLPAILALIATIAPLFGKLAPAFGYTIVTTPSAPPDPPINVKVNP